MVDTCSFLCCTWAQARLWLLGSSSASPLPIDPPFLPAAPSSPAGVWSCWREMLCLTLITFSAWKLKMKKKNVNVLSKHVKLFWTPGAKPWLTINYISLQRNVRGQRTAWSNTLRGSWQENGKFGLKWKIFCFAGSWCRANNNRAGAGLKCPWPTGVLQTSLRLLKQRCELGHFCSVSSNNNNIRTGSW